MGITNAIITAVPISQRTVPYCINFILQLSKQKEIQQAELQSATENGRLSLQAVPPSSSQPTTAAFPCSTITNTATHSKMLQGSLNPFRGLDQRQKGAPHAPQRLAKAVGWSGVDFNLLKFRTVITRMETKFQKKFPPLAHFQVNHWMWMFILLQNELETTRIIFCASIC